MTRGRDDGGRFADGIDPDTVMDVFDAREDRARPVTATDVVDELDVSRRTAHNKLNALVERGVLETRKIGARGRVWWIPILDAHSVAQRRDDGETDEDRRDAAGGPDETHTSPADPAVDDDVQDDVQLDETLSDRAYERVVEIDAEYGLAGDGLDWERRRDAVVHLYEHLRRHEGERFRKSQLADVLDDADVPTGFNGGFSSLWGNWVKGSGDRPNILASFPGVEQRGNSYVFESELVDA